MNVLVMMAVIVVVMISVDMVVMLVAIMRFPFGCCFDFHGCKHSSISNKSSPHRSIGFRAMNAKIDIFTMKPFFLVMKRAGCNIIEKRRHARHYSLARGRHKL